MIVQYEHGDPGGRAALEPVLDRLNEQGVDIIRQPNLRDHADILITSTSDGVYTKEKELTLQARQYGVPSLSILDYWSHYRQRYSNERDELMYLPDMIAVMDEYAKTEMIVLGFPADVIEVTGQPAFDCLEEKRQKYAQSYERRWNAGYTARRGHGYGEDTRLAIFLSQPIASSDYGWGFNEHKVIPMFLDAVQSVAPDCQVLIRPHPREDSKGLFRYEYYNDLDVKIRRSDGIHELMVSADLVAGMNTVMLVEACYLGCITLSIQPGKIGPDRLPTNRLGFSRAVYDPLDLEYNVDGLMNNYDVRMQMTDNLEHFRVKESATDKVVELVNRMVT